MFALLGGSRLTGGGAETDCPVCIEDLGGEGRTISILNPCGHVFHTNCLLRSIHATGQRCPTCRVVPTPPITRWQWQQPRWITGPRPMIELLTESLRRGHDLSDFMTSNIEFIVTYGLFKRGLSQRDGGIDFLTTVIRQQRDFLGTEDGRTILNLEDFDGRTATYLLSQLATTDDDITALRYLIQAGAGLERKNKHGKTPLFAAAEFNNINALRLLILAGANVNTPSNIGMSPCHINIRNADTPDALTMLINARGVDINAADRNGATPLHWAIHKEKNAFIELLLGAPTIDINKVDANGATPCYLAAHYGYTSALSLLIRADADVNKARTDNGETPVFIAAYYGYTSALSLLIRADADVNKARTDNGETPIFVAARKGHVDILSLLLNVPGVDINKATQREVTPVFAAVSAGQMAALSLLIEAEADLDKANVDGRTPSHAAAASPNAGAFRLLLDAGANYGTRDHGGLTPLDMANARGASEIVEMIKDAFNEQVRVVRRLPMFREAERRRLKRQKRE